MLSPACSCLGSAKPNDFARAMQPVGWMFPTLSLKERRNKKEFGNE